jgi:ribosomal protein S4E
MADSARSGVAVGDGDHCLVTGGTHKGKSGLVEDSKTSKTGHLTITVRQTDGVRFKTLARNVEMRPRPA